MTAQPPTQRNDLLRQHVSKKVAALQTRHSVGDSSATATLARLRRAVNRQPGSDPSVWAATFEDFPPELLGAGDAPSAFERAAHATITLFAIHQQSQSQPMHKAGVGIGRAVQRLGFESGSPEAVLRRFQALGTASTFAESMHHLRGLLTQLRAKAIPLDYGALAVDLADIQDARRADRVRLAWGRDYYRVESTATIQS